MKHLLLKTWLLMLCLLTLGGGNNAWAETVTKSISDIVSENSYTVSFSSTINTKCTSINLDANINVSVTVKNGATGNTGTFWGTSPNIDWRLYQGDEPTITVSAGDGYSISTVKFTYSNSNTGVINTSGHGQSIGSTYQITSGKAYDVNAASATYYVGNTSSKTNGQARITAIEVVYSSTSGGGSTPTALSVPTNLSSSNVTTTGATLSWDEVANASSYTVKIGETEHTGVNTNSYSATGLTAGTQYAWTVKAVGDGVNYTTSAYAANANFTTDSEQGGGDGTTVTWIASEQGYTSGERYTSATVDGNISLAFGDGGNDGKYYDTGTGIRLYANGKVTVSAKQGYTINSIVLTYSGDSYTGTFSASAGSYILSSTTGTWSGSASSVVLTNKATSGHARIQKIAVTYSAAKVLQTITVSGTPTKTTYTAGESFDPAGLTVTGHYDDESEETITEGITWSTPAALTAGQTSVNITATVNGVTSEEYNVTGLTVTAPRTLSSIAVKTAPTKTTYTEGEFFDPTGMEITKTYNDASTEDLAYAGNESAFTFVPALTTALQTSDANVQITVEDKTTTQAITVNAIPTHTAHFSVNGTINNGNDQNVKEGEAITFPADPSAPEEHVFIGWKKGGDEVTTPQDEAIATVDKATEVMGTEDVTYYAVWAVPSTSEGDWTIFSSDLAVKNSSASSGYDKYKGDQTKDGYTVNITDVYPASGSNDGKIQFKSSSGVMYNKTSFGKIKKIEIAGGGMNVYQNSSQINSATELTAITKETTPSSPVTYMFSTNDNNGYFFIKNGGSTSYITSIKVYYAGTSYSDYSTKVSTKIKPTLSFANPTYNATMGEEFETPALNNPQQVTVSYSSSAESVASVNSETGVVELVGAGTTTITASFAGDETYNKASASYQLVVKAATPVFASLEELVAADLTTGTEVTVSFENVPIKSFQTVSSVRKGVYFDIQKSENDIEIYFNAEIPAEWAVGGTLSGTLTNCPWKLYSGTWELAPALGWAWSNLTYNAPANYAPAITTQPVSATYEWNASASNLTIVATGNPNPTYQWYSNTTNSNENGTVLTGETNASYKPSTATAGTFYYYCVATNSEGSAASSVATITVKEPVVASLPFAFDAGKNDISSKDGMSQSGLGSDYSSSPKLKFDSQGDNVVINFNEAAKKVTYTIKGNSMSGTYAFDVMESANGVEYTNVHHHTPITDGEYTDNLASTSRFVKFVYTTKDGGNVALGKISIIAASYREEPNLAFDKDTYKFIAGKDMQVAATSKAGSTGAITYALTEGDEDAFLIDENTGYIVCETAGTYTVTATIAGNADYYSGSTTCTVNVLEPIVGNSIIVAEADGKYYAMTTTYNSNGYFTHKEIKKIGDKYVVSSLDDILFYTSTADGKTTIQSTSTNEYVQSTAAKNISYTEDEYKWKNDGEKLTAATESYGTLQYNTSSPRFTTYASKTGQYATIVNLADVVLGFDLSVSSVGYATLCLPFNATVPEGATVYTGKYNSENGSVKLNEVEGDKIKAGEGYIVANEGTHTFTETSDEVEAPENNHLKGVTERTQLTGDGSIYIFANQTKGVGFYKLGDNKTAYLAANKAYLKLPAGGGVNAREFVGFGDDTETGINAVDVVDALPMTDGKYLKDGKIVIVKNGVKYNVNGQRTR